MAVNQFFSQLKALGREFSEFERLFSPENKELRRLVFYAESSIYFRYYQDYIEYILSNSNFEICYITSDPADKIFANHDSRIKPFFIKNLLPGALAKLDAKVLVMTAPDLGSTGAGISIKRAPAPVHHVYAFHGISSTHQYYRPAAFNNYDSILCIGQYQIDELRKTESIYELPAKELILTGYPLVERLYREHQQYKAELAHNKDGAQRQRPVCLIAPSWWWISPESSIMENCIDQIIKCVDGRDWDVWLRPHPEYLKRYSKRVDEIGRRLASSNNVTLKTELSSMQVLHEADILVTDHSTIAMDFFIATERPVLFIDTPLHVGNADFKNVGMEPVENAFRGQMGFRLPPDRIDQIASTIETLLAQQEDFAKKVPEIRSSLVANWQSAAKTGAEHILRKCGS